MYIKNLNIYLITLIAQNMTLLIFSVSNIYFLKYIILNKIKCLYMQWNKTP